MWHTRVLKAKALQACALCMTRLHTHATLLSDSTCACCLLFVQIIIVDPETSKRKGDLEVGEIWLDSPSKAIG